MKHQYPLPPPIWVDQPASFRAMMDHLRGEPAVAVDTESNSLYVYQEQVCLVQISVPSADYLVDPLTLADLSELGPLLADPRVLKVFHGAEYDLSSMHRDFQFVVTNLFDTMWASRILGWPAHGLAALLNTHFGVQLDKRYQRANWGLRPLPSNQLDYARKDTHYLLALQKIQARELETRRRWPQAQHRFNRLVQTRWEPRDFEADGFWRLPGARDLDDVGRGVLREVFILRDERARTENRPPFKVLSNRAMVALGEQRPHGLRGLEQIKGISRRTVHKYGRALLAAVRRGAGRPISWDERPRPTKTSKPRSNGRPSAACQARFEMLRNWRNTTAELRGVEADIVMTNHTLWEVAFRNPRSYADLGRDDLLAPWQIDEYGRDLLAVIAKKH